MATADVSWLEFARPPAATAALSWLEFGAGANALLSWLEFAPPALPETTASVSWLEFSAPHAGETAALSWLEFSASGAPTVYTLTADAGAYVATWAGSVGQIVLDAEPAAYSMTAQEATLSVSAPPDTTAAAIWDFVLPSGLTPAQLLSELHKIHGLLPSAPLAVTSATRTAGDISQSITDSSGVVTVTRN